MFRANLLLLFLGCYFFFFLFYIYIQQIKLSVSSHDVFLISGSSSLLHFITSFPYVLYEASVSHFSVPLPLSPPPSAVLPARFIRPPITLPNIFIQFTAFPRNFLNDLFLYSLYIVREVITFFDATVMCVVLFSFVYRE